MSIRAATPADAHAIASLQVRAWQAAYRGIVPAQLLAELSVEGTHEASGVATARMRMTQ